MSDQQETRDSGHPTEALLAAYLSGDLKGEELLLTGDHLASCAECSAAISSPSMRSAVLDDLRADRHLSFEELGALADEEAELPDHVRECSHCREGLDDLIKLREDLVSSDRPAPAVEESGRTPWRMPQALKWLLIPAFGAIVIAGLWVWISNDREAPTTAGPTAPAQGPVEESAVPAPPEDVPQAVPEVAVRLIDGTREITVDSEGNLSGIDSAEMARKAKAALLNGELRIDSSSKKIFGETGVLMSRDNPAVPFRLQSPVGVVIEARTPRFNWESLDGAESYSVEVFDNDFNKIASSGEIEGNNWNIPGALERGEIYTWQVIAKKGDEEVRSPVRPAPDASFKIASAEAARGIAEALKSRSGLLLGLAYAEAGMLPEAEREFVRLQRMNPRSKKIGDLLRKIRAAR